jgi:hypothetical protein
LAAATSFIASVIFMVFFTEAMRSRTWVGARGEAGPPVGGGRGGRGARAPPAALGRLQRPAAAARVARRGCCGRPLAWARSDWTMLHDVKPLRASAGAGPHCS